MRSAHRNFFLAIAFGLLGACQACAAAASTSQTSQEPWWPMHRGGPSLRGVAAGALPPRLALNWRFKTGGPVKSSAAIQDRKVFIGSDDGHLYALEFETGKKLWEFKTGGAVESCPLVLDGRVYFGSSDTFAYCLEAETGREIWKYETGDKILASLNYTRNGSRTDILAGSYDYKLYSLNASTGQTNWVYETGNYINGTPAVSAGVTAFGGCDALLHVISLVDGIKVKEVEVGAYIAGSACLLEGKAYFGHYENEFLCIDIAQGKRDWTYRDRNFPYFSSPAVISDRVVFGGRDKQVHCVNRADGVKVWTLPTRGKVDSSPVVCGDKVVVGSDDGRVYLINLSDGKELWSYEIGQPVGSSPAVAQGRVVIGADDGTVYCFGPR